MKSRRYYSDASQCLLARKWQPIRIPESRVFFSKGRGEAGREVKISRRMLRHRRVLLRPSDEMLCGECSFVGGDGGKGNR